MKGTLVNKPNEITWALGKRKKLILTPNIFLLCPSFLHLNMFNILSVKGIWKKKKKGRNAQMDLTWVTIPRSEKSSKLMTRPAPSRLSQ